MSEVLHANIFFVIASIATVIFTVLVALILYHAYKIIRALRRMVERVEASSEMIAGDVEEFRSFVRRGSFISHIVSFVSSMNRRK